jgi:hypothetical protein
MAGPFKGFENRIIFCAYNNFPRTGDRKDEMIAVLIGRAERFRKNTLSIIALGNMADGCRSHCVLLPTLFLIAGAS